MDQGDLTDGVIAPSRGWLTPARALLLLLAAVLGGVVLSLALGSSPAHAADGDGTSSGSDPLAAAAHSVTATLVTTMSTTTGTSIPAAERTVARVIQHTVDASATTLVNTVPAAAPVVAPVVSSVETTLAATLSTTAWTVQQLTGPAATAVDLAALAATVPSAATAAAIGHPSAGLDAHPIGAAISAAVPGVLGGSGADGALPGSLVGSSSSAPPAAIAVLLTAFVLALLAARRRVIQNALPSSPVFDTDTSPA